MVRRARVLVGWGILASAAAATGGCGWILGLEEFTDRPAGTECTVVEQCPTGEHGSPVCQDGQCGFSCEGGFADCTDAPGCETETTADRANCGACGVSCAAFCAEGSCNDPVDIAAGGSHACAILEDGSLWCWGAVPGPGAEVEIRTEPTRVELPGPAVQVAVAGFYTDIAGYIGSTCALLDDARVRCWGRNDYGQLGLGHTDWTATPEDIGLGQVRQISAKSLHACAVTTQDELFCWGQGGLGQIGDGGTSDVLTPVSITTSVAQVSAGFGHTCAVKLDTSAECWGANIAGEIGLGDGAPSPVTTPSPIPQEGYVDVHCGAAFSCARLSNGVRCWGSNMAGQLGISSTDNKSTPTLLNIAVVDVLEVGSSHAGAIVAGDLYIWGDNTHRQLGTSSALDALSPTPIDMTGVSRIALGAYFSCAMTEASEILCWGDNHLGQLGDGTTEDRITPTPVVWP